MTARLHAGRAAIGDACLHPIRFAAAAAAMGPHVPGSRGQGGRCALGDACAAMCVVYAHTTHICMQLLLGSLQKNDAEMRSESARGPGAGDISKQIDN